MTTRCDGPTIGKIRWRKRPNRRAYRDNDRIHRRIPHRAALRDALLPKLISGELRLPAALREREAQAGVKDAERFLKERGL
jgi:hypothetical protein